MLNRIVVPVAIIVFGLYLCLTGKQGLTVGYTQLGIDILIGGGAFVVLGAMAIFGYIGKKE